MPARRAGPVDPAVVVTVYEEHDVYVGRAFRSRKGGYWGNPFKGEGSIPAFEEVFLKRLKGDSTFKVRTLALRGLRLACYCAPDDCHGDVIAAWVNKQPLKECRAAAAKLGKLRSSAEGKTTRQWLTEHFGPMTWEL
jgi:hypothetical protein